MIHGLLWLPLLALFIGLAWAGWNEYQKLEAYKIWAADFDRTKYDIRSVLGQSGNAIVWGQPDRGAPKNLQTFSLKNVERIQLVVDGEVVDPLNPPNKGKSIVLEFVRSGEDAVQVPFTQVDLAVQWGQALMRDLVV
jgi:hypothetical protein